MAIKNLALVGQIAADVLDQLDEVVVPPGAEEAVITDVIVLVRMEAGQHERVAAATTPMSATMFYGLLEEVKMNRWHMSPPPTLLGGDDE